MTSIRDLATAASTVWHLQDCAHRSGETLAKAACDAAWSPAGWLPATVPGLVAQDLQRHGRIPDPYWGDNVTACRWIEDRDWVWRTEVTVSEAEAATPCRLVCTSIDGFATIWLNGERIAAHENQFRRLVLDLTGKLKAGVNTLAVACEASWPGTVRRAESPLPFWNEPWERLWVRKSQMSYGWDWASRVPTAGIADDIRLEFSEGAWAGDLELRGTPQPGGAGAISASLPLTATAALDGQAELLIDGKVLASVPLHLAAGASTTVALNASIAQAKLWWPQELGTPHLYRAELRISAGGKVLHRSSAQVGIRTIELVTRDPGSPNGKVFWLRINGTRLWAKGENWLPMDFLHTRVQPEQYRSYLAQLAAGGVNCIRVWGGGIIEHAAFYDACDELGLLVWHDFPFACGIYPTTPAFLAEVEREAEDIVSRLRSRTCLALWCGNNENELIGQPLGRQHREHPIYYQVLPRVLRKLDAVRAWWPGSPASESIDVHPDSDQEGDRHNWNVWFGWASSEHVVDEARFNSEFGAQAFPQRETIESFMRPDEAWSPGAVSRPQGMSPGLVWARHGAQMEKLFGQGGRFGPLHGLDQIIATTQSFQAETIGRYLRHYRRLMDRSGGCIVWNYTSVWPSICWALVDWYRRPKQAYYECRSCFRPVVVGVEPIDESLSSFQAAVSRDRPGCTQGELSLRLMRLADGGVVAEEKAQITLTDHQAVVGARLALPVGLDRLAHAVVAEFRHEGRIERDIRYLANKTDIRGQGRLCYPHGKLTVTRHADRIEMQASAWRLRVGLESLEAPAVWEENYIDLLPGEKRTFRLSQGAMPGHLWVVADMGTRRKLPEEGAIVL